MAPIYRNSQLLTSYTYQRPKTLKVDFDIPLLQFKNQCFSRAKMLYFTKLENILDKVFLIY